MSRIYKHGHYPSELTMNIYKFNPCEFHNFHYIINYNVSYVVCVNKYAN